MAQLAFYLDCMVLNVQIVRELWAIFLVIQAVFLPHPKKLDFVLIVILIWTQIWKQLNRVLANNRDGADRENLAVRVKFRGA